MLVLLRVYFKTLSCTSPVACRCYSCLPQVFVPFCIVESFCIHALVWLFSCSPKSWRTVRKGMLYSRPHRSQDQCKNTIKGVMIGLKRHEHYLLSQALCTSEQLTVHSQLGSASQLVLELTTGSQKGNLSLARAKTVKCLCVSSARSPVAASLCRHGGGGKRTDNKQLKAPCVTCHDSGAENVGLTVNTRGCLLLF